MAQQNRTVLKGYFNTGDVPTEAQFADLIDSSPNTSDDGTVLISGGALGTPSSGVATNLTGTAAGLTAGNVTTNANLTGDVTSVGNATTIAVDAVDIPMLSATGTASSSTFLRGDNTWSTPAGSGDVTKVGTPANDQIGVWTGDGTIEGTSALTFGTSVLGLTGGLKFAERADHAATPAAGFGELWLKSDAPNVLIFTDDAGTDNTILTESSVTTLTAIDAVVGTDNLVIGDTSASDAAKKSTVTSFISDMSLAVLGANTFTGTQDFNGQQVEGALNKVVTLVTGALTAADHSGNVLKTSGNVTVPTTAGFNAVIIAGGAHTVTFNATTSAAMATGDVMTVVVESSTVIHAVLTAAADKVSFT